MMIVVVLVLVIIMMVSPDCNTVVVVVVMVMMIKDCLFVTPGDWPTENLGPGFEERNINMAFGFLPEDSGALLRHVKTIEAVNGPSFVDEQFDNLDVITPLSKINGLEYAGATGAAAQ